ncbi:MAG: alpha/beta hydrolase [Wenzhouxiangellaceae bacterium]
MTNSANEQLECVVRETGPAPRHAVIWLHGLGADGHDFAPIVPQLQCARSRAVRFVFPHAPVRPVTVNGGMRMRAWYDILGFEISRDQDRRGIADSVTCVERLIARELEQGIEPRNLILAGFSQGGAIALRTGLARGTGLGGVMALSCYLLDETALMEWSTPAGRATAVFMAHGLHDPIVPLALGRRGAEVLSGAGVAVEWSEYPMQHAVCPEELMALDRWLDARFDAGNDSTAV